MKALTSLAALDSGKCMNFVRYKTKLLAFAKKARFSKTSTASQHTHTHTHKEKKKQTKEISHVISHGIDRENIFKSLGK